MQAKPVPPSKRAAGEPDGAEEGVERDGPLEVRRLRKDDGRQLIAYSRADPAGAEDGATGTPAPEQ